MKDKYAKRWSYLLNGDLAVVPVYDEDGDLQFVMIESSTFTAKCYSPEEVNNAVDIAMARYGEVIEMSIH